MDRDLSVSGQRSEIFEHLVYAGPHRVEDWGWEMAFVFGNVRVSIAETRWTRGVELMAWEFMDSPLVDVTVEDVVRFLLTLTTPIGLRPLPPNSESANLGEYVGAEEL